VAALLREAQEKKRRKQPEWMVTGWTEIVLGGGTIICHWLAGLSD
jgi:hypothetical protein